MNPDLRTLLQSFLNALEREEARLLAWGVVDGAFTEDEVLDIADRVLHEAAVTTMTPEDLLRQARSYGLIFEFPPETTATDDDRDVYRTRMAETVRLLARLRQLGPGRPWRAAPSLVADYRFMVRPRAYPRRYRPPASVRDEIEQAVRLRPVQIQALDALLQSPGGPLSLADFQVKAAAGILRDLDRPRHSRGTIIGAGTGSGKTLAFYLPAFLHIAQRITETSDENWVKAVAIYPRKELLKDQLSGAVAAARAVDDALARHRPITIGAYYGDTPYRANRQSVEWKWARSEAGDGFACPYLRSPNGEPMTWRDEDIAAGTERLVGRTAEGEPIVYGPDVVRLTRASCVSSPPDIVFTTTEMMNRLMVNGGDRRVIGLHDKYPVQRPPELVLLDESHTYNGLTGAHTAYLLRRWRQALRTRPQFVGLSATLVGAQDFFARLVGINPASVVEVSPREDALVQEGAEYLVALRGDPGTGTSLLSTSIQATMLLGRALDPASNDFSGGLYGRRTFAFTDNLDVTNRFYHSLLSAEGQGRGGVPLATTRSQHEPDSLPRLRAGQNWRMSEDIDHQQGLTVPLRVDRTSSQDAGVDARADVVVATASLEVGFDDPYVGAVLQHKAPLDNASFLQRKGRAGRKREMRPWTAIVLSDYGRDRVAYQAYDALFDPSLREQNLPTANRYVLRIQAGFAFMDWLTEQMCRAGVGEWPDNVWNDLAYPARRERDYRRARRAERQAWIRERLDALLRHGTGLQDLSNYLADALGIEADEVTALLWEPPRAVMTALLPTLLRRLAHEWRAWRPDGSEADEPFTKNPLPDFLPPNFFTDLNLPEVEVLLPAHHNREAEEHPMPIRQALSEFAPGRVSRRFGVRHADDAFWVPVDLDDPLADQRLDLDAFVPVHEPIGTVHVRDGARTIALRAVRPRQLQTALLVPGQIRPSSNAFMSWASVLRPHPDAEWTPVSDATGWTGLVPRIAFHLHRDDTPADVARVAHGARAEVGFLNPNIDDRTIHTRFVAEDRPVGVGFLHTFDAVTFDLVLPETLGDEPPDIDTPLGRALGVAYVHHLVATSRDLDGIANSFARAWLSEALVSSLVLVAADDGAGGAEALRNAADAIWDDTDGPSPFEVALQEVMAAAVLDDDDDADRRGHDRVRTLLDDPAVRPALDDAAASLWAAGVGADYRDWVRHRYRATVGGALLQAVYALCPEIGGADLYLDLDGGPRSADDPVRGEVWISESAVGGTGLLETFARRYADDPRRFFRLADVALAPSDAEQVDVELGRILSLAGSDVEVRDALADVRAANGLRDLRDRTARLRRTLAQKGVLCSHPVFAALQARVLRPGASPASDDLLLRLVQAWRDLEGRLGVEIDARGLALWAARQTAFEADLDALVGGPADASQRFGVLYGLVWPRGRSVRARALSSYNPFAQAPDPDRLLVADGVEAVPTVALDDADWNDRLRDGLRDRGVARLAAPLGRDADLAAATLALAQEPLDVGFLLLYPVLDGLERDAEHVVARLSLPESVQ